MMARCAGCPTLLLPALLWVRVCCSLLCSSLLLLILLIGVIPLMICVFHILQVFLLRARAGLMQQCLHVSFTLALLSLSCCG